MSRRGTFGTVLLVLVLALLAGYWLLNSQGMIPGGFGPQFGSAPPKDNGAPTPSTSEVSAPATLGPHGSVQPEETFTSGEESRGNAVLTTRGARPRGPLLIPVAGVRPEELVDTYAQARSEGRRHDAIDIAAARGTPVLAVAEGTVLKLFRSDQGGITLYQLDPDQRTIFYYAHLDRYAPAIAEGIRIGRGDTIGYVGDSGNARPGDYHLPFEVSTTPDPEQYWGGTPTNPYPLLGGTPAPRKQ